jgi:long-chain acyl-CoA synthetase
VIALQTPDTVIELLERTARATPTRVACLQRNTQNVWVPTAWIDLWREVQQLAIAFRRLGLGRGERLAILARTRREWLVAEMAGLLANSVIVGIDPHATPELVGYMMAHADARGVVTDNNETLQRIPEAIRDQLKFIVLLEDRKESGDARIVQWQDLVSGKGSVAANLELPLAGDPATLIYTSGTTGMPKGIEYTHSQLMISCRAMQDATHELRDGDTTICWLPMAYLYQRMLNLVAIAHGMSTYFVDDPRQIVECLNQVEPTGFCGVPRFYEKVHEGIQKKLMQQPRWRRRVAHWALRIGAERAQLTRDGRKVSWWLHAKHSISEYLVLKKLRRVMGRNIKYMITGSAPTPVWLLEFFHGMGLLILEGYALSENTIPIALNRPDAYRFGSVGKVFPHNELKFAEDGEILVKGPGLFKGYYKEGQTSDRFTADGFYRTGDLGRLDEDGFLFFVGRKAEIIKTSTGRRIGPARIEAVYRQSPFLDHVILFGNGRTHLVALVTVNSAALADRLKREAILQTSAEELARWPLVKNLIQEELQCLGQVLAPYERIGGFAILPSPLTVATGELTSSLKARRDRIESRYGHLIAQLYKDNASL